MLHSHVWHDSFIRDCSTLIYMCDITHSHVRCDSFTCVTWLFHTWLLLTDPEQRVTKCTETHIHLRAATHSYVRHDSLMCDSFIRDAFFRVPQLVHMWDVTHSHVWHSVRAMTYSKERHDSFTCVWHSVRAMTYFKERYDSITCVTLEVSFFASHDLFIGVSKFMHRDSWICEVYDSSMREMAQIWLPYTNKLFTNFTNKLATNFTYSVSWLMLRVMWPTHTWDRTSSLRVITQIWDMTHS